MTGVDCPWIGRTAVALKDAGIGWREPLFNSGKKDPDFTDDGARYVYALFDSFEGAVCADCTKETIKRLDFSHLSDITHFPERDDPDHVPIPNP